MSRTEIIFRSTVEIRRTAKLRFQKSAIHDQLTEDGGFENSWKTSTAVTWPGKDLIWMPYEMSFSIGSERISFQSYFTIHLQRVEMFAVQRSDENELERNFLPACFVSRVKTA